MVAPNKSKPTLSESSPRRDRPTTNEASCRNSGTLWEQRAASGPEARELRDSERIYASESTHAYLGTAGSGTREGTVGCEGAGGAARFGADLRVYACVSRHRRPRRRDSDPGPARGPPAVTAWAAASGPEELRYSERIYASTHAYLGTAGRGPARGLWAAVRGPGAGGAQCVTRTRSLGAAGRPGGS
jgi:hypothetical protein